MTISSAKPVQPAQIPTQAPRKSFAEAARATPTPRSSPPSENRKAFILRVPHGILPAGPPVAPTTALLRERLPAMQNLVISDAVRMGDQKAAARIYLILPTFEMAAELVSFRHLLKGSGITLFDVLSAEERKLHRKLWPSYLAALAAGKKAQFSRACLKVDGVRIEAPSSSRSP